jgi:GntR family transcriptional regulator
MIIEIDTHGGVPIYRQVMDQVKHLIMTGQLAEGEQLESVKRLSTRLKVNPMTVSKAYSFLVQEGLVERRRGVGLFVGQIRSDTKTRLKNSILADALKKAASLAAQMDIGEEEAMRLFGKHFRQIASQKGRKTK